MSFDQLPQRIAVWYLLASVLSLISFASHAQSLVPNILYILTDDLGYGDIGALNPQNKIKTPQLDKLISQSTTFTEAHSSSAVCTPSRYSILTGRYNWRPG
jgi:arylsulfatase A